MATILGMGVVHARDLTFDDRVRCQEAIERVRYRHQIGATRRFEEVLPRAAIERKVRTYLKQSAALEAFWRTPVTAGMLERETARMVRGTRMPERLRELFAALANDAFVVQECLARPVLADRLSRNFYAFDGRFHAQAREEARRLRAALLRLGAEAFERDPRRSVVELVRTDPSGPERPSPTVDRHIIEASPDEYVRRRGEAPARSGEVGPVLEERGAFVIRVVLEEDARRARIATFAVGKRPWDDWWAEASPGFADRAVAAVATDAASLPAGALPPGASCLPDDTWDNASLDDVPHGRQYHTAVWTGSVMVIWGGVSDIRTGGRYDPATDTWSPTSTAGAPGGRLLHTAVWTGSEMIVWGGVGGVDSDTGGRYDPVNDTWKPMSSNLAPEGRQRHTAVWTGREMIVWGGQDAGYLNTGGRYDPATDRWTATSVTGAPTARAYHAAVWTGSRMVVWGGYGGFGFEITGALYDPATNTWSQTSTVGAPAHRILHTAVWTGSRMVVWGGSGGFGSIMNTGGRYDPATDSWVATSTDGAPSARREHQAVWTGNVMIVWGGYGDSPTGDPAGGRYDPEADFWAPTATSGVPAPRSRHSTVWTGEVMIVWGGSDRDGPVLDTGGRYDPVADAWTPTATAAGPSPRGGHAAVWTGNVMVVWGGSGGGVDLNTGGRYDPAADTWSPTSVTGAPQRYPDHSTVWTGDTMLVWGGQLSPAAGVSTGGRYDPVADTWSTTSTTGAPEGRWGHTAVWTGREMVIWGGWNSGGTATPMATGGRYDPVRDAWTPTSTTETVAARWRHTAVWTGSEMIVWGGYGGPDMGYLDTGGRYDPSTDAWAPIATTGAPSARYLHTALWTGSEMIVWGGYLATDFETGGRYDPSADTWSATSVTGVPTARRWHTMIWTGREIVVWGGLSGSSSQDTGGRYVPSTDTWSPTSLVGAPSPRSGHTAVWTGSEMIVWGSGTESGGRYALGHELDDDGDGLSECGGDCNDGNQAVRPGAGEVCDGFDNDCDGEADNVPLPGPTSALAASLSGPDTLLSWSPVGHATGYDIVRGDLAILIGSGGDFTAATHACLADDLPGTSIAFSEEPAAGGGFWYVVRAINCAGSGVYDSSGPGQARPRDPGIGASASACP